MKITVGICTWNRANLLKQTLERMNSLLIPDGLTWELLIVNNNCTDDTDKVLNYYTNILPLRRLFEPNQGKSNALNLAIQEAEGDLILWTDDDVLVDKEWLSAYVSAVKLWPEGAFFGGPIEPWFEGDPPNWLKKVYPRVETAYASRNLGIDPCLLTEDTLPYGANMAIRSDVQRRYLYDPNLGPLPNRDLRGEETAVLRLMVRDGLVGRWVPEAKVKHYIPRKRQTISYLRSFYRGAGKIHQGNLERNGCSKLFGKPRWALRMAIENEVLFLIKRLFCKPDSWIKNLIKGSFTWGIYNSLYEKKLQQGND